MAPAHVKHESSQNLEDGSRGAGPPDLEEIKAFFDAPGIVAVFLFGSAAGGTGNPLSDIDLAYLGKDYESEDRAFDPLYESLQGRLGEGSFDLVPLRRATLHIRFQVTTEGRLLACKDPAALERFAADTIVQYLDFKPIRDAYFAAGR